MKSVFLWPTRLLSLYLVYRINAIDVSVCLDATYPLAFSQKSDICSGSGDKPLGILCPLKGDLAVAACHPFLPSFVVGGGCILQEDAECQIITGTTWGCVLPSIGCEQQETQCLTWVVTNSDETVNIDTHSIDKNEEYDENWFVQTSPVMELYNCEEKPTPAPTEAPRLTTPQPTKDALVPKTLAPSTLEPPVTKPTTAMPTPEPTISTPAMMEPRTPCPTTSRPVTPRPTILGSETPHLDTTRPVTPPIVGLPLILLPNTTESATPCPSTTGPATASPTTYVGLRQSLHHL